MLTLHARTHDREMCAPDVHTSRAAHNPALAHHTTWHLPTDSCVL